MDKSILGRPAQKVNSNFQNHAGGVIRVKMPPGQWGAVPVGILEDDKLDLDARAIAAWLSIQRHDWKIVVPDILGRFKIGRDRWQKIARQLSAAGYLTRSCHPAGEKTACRDGKSRKNLWIWENIFSPDPEFQGSGAGFSGSGTPGDGQAGSIPMNESNKNKSNNKTITPPPPQPQKPPIGGGGGEGGEGEERTPKTCAEKMERYEVMLLDQCVGKRNPSMWMRRAMNRILLEGETHLDIEQLQLFELALRQRSGPPDLSRMRYDEPNGLL